MLNSSFSESSNSGVLLPGERKVYTVVVEEADFVTICWLLKWVYANWLLSARRMIPKPSTTSGHVGSARGLGKDEWEWKAFAEEVPSGSQSGGGLSDDRSVASGESARSSSGGDKGKQTRVATQSRTTPSMRASHPGGSVSSKNPPSTASVGPSPQPTRHPTNSATSGNPPAWTIPLANTSSPSAPREPKPVPIPLSPSTTNFSLPTHYPLSPHQRQRNPAVSTQTPMPILPLASALSVYQVAHRYSIPRLASLALAHHGNGHTSVKF